MRLTELDRRSFRAFYEVLGRELGRSGLGRVQMRDWVLEALRQNEGGVIVLHDPEPDTVKAVPPAIGPCAGSSELAKRMSAPASTSAQGSLNNRSVRVLSAARAAAVQQAVSANLAWHVVLASGVTSRALSWIISAVASVR